MRNKLPRRLIGGIVALGLVIAALWNLGGASPRWDEGWTLSVARTWVERGFYGRLQDGQLAPPGLEASFPTTGLVALSFRLFGVGVWQGRLPIVLCVLGALALVYYLAAWLYNQPVANATLALLILTPMYRQLHPLLVGRQVLAEPVMLLFLLGGYCCLSLALSRSRWFFIPAVICWAVGLYAKAQLPPFWALSLMSMIGACAFRRQWRLSGWLTASMLSTLVLMRLLMTGRDWLLQNQTLPPVPLSGLYGITAVVLILPIRLNTLHRVILFGLPTIVGLAWGTKQAVAHWRDSGIAEGREIVRLGLLILAGSWLAWFALLSVGEERYLFPATFIASIFLAALLYEATDHFDLSATFRRAVFALRKLLIERQHASAILVVAFAAMTVPVTARTLFQEYVLRPDDSALEMTNFLNTQIPPTAVIETYNSEIHFLTDRHYHYPPDQTHIDLIRRIISGQFQNSIAYDPLLADPDYLIDGGLPRDWGLYFPVIADGSFRQVTTIGDYDIYQRVR